MTGGKSRSALSQRSPELWRAASLHAVAGGRLTVHFVSSSSRVLSGIGEALNQVARKG